MEIINNNNNNNNSSALTKKIKEIGSKFFYSI